jgi:hypothetical protein
MAAHSEVTKALNKKRLSFDDSSPGITTLTAANTTLSMQDLRDIEHAAAGSGFELVFSNGALKIRPRDSAL